MLDTNQYFLIPDIRIGSVSTANSLRRDRQTNKFPVLLPVSVIMAKREEESHSDESSGSEPEHCVWCRPGSEALKPNDERRKEKAANQLAKGKGGDDKSGSDPEGEQTDSDYELELSWIRCTKCKTWYHSDCVTLQELVEPIGEHAPAHGQFGAPGASGSLPPEVIRELEKQGYDWNWTAAVDKW